MNRDRGKWVGPLKGVHVTMYTAWHARAVSLWTAAINTTCQFHSFVDGHLGYSHVLGWEERKSSRLMAKGEIFIKGEVGTVSECASLSHLLHRLEPQFASKYSQWQFINESNFIQICCMSKLAILFFFSFKCNNQMGYGKLWILKEVKLCAKAETGLKDKL